MGDTEIEDAQPNASPPQRRGRWWNSALGGVVIGALAATTGTLITDERARSSDTAARREERRVEAYGDLVETAEQGVLLATQLVIADSIEQEGMVAVDPQQAAQLLDEYDSIFDFYRESLPLPSLVLGWLAAKISRSSPPTSARPTSRSRWGTTSQT